MLVAWLMSLTVEPGTVAPFWSEMIPLTPPVEVCAEAVRHDNARQKSNDTAALNNLMALTSRYVRMPRAEANCRGACALRPRDARGRLTWGAARRWFDRRTNLFLTFFPAPGPDCLINRP